MLAVYAMFRSEAVGVCVWYQLYPFSGKLFLLNWYLRHVETILDLHQLLILVILFDFEISL